LPRSRKTRAVLAVLALAAPRSVLRSRLIDLLWSRRAKEQGQASLRQSVHELQRSLGREASVPFQTDRNQLALFDHRLWVDVRILDAATVSHPDGLALFQPSLLDDLIGLDPAFDKWLGSERQRICQRARSLAEGVLAIAFEARSQIAAAEQLLLIDPLH